MRPLNSAGTIGRVIDNRFYRIGQNQQLKSPLLLKAVAEELLEIKEEAGQVENLTRRHRASLELR